MVSIQEALSIIQGQEVDSQWVKWPLARTLGHYLSEPIVSPINLPSFDNSAMDGYAVCGIRNDYQIVGEVAAGSSKIYSLKEGEAVRIFTGGRIPENTTTVVVQEKVKAFENSLTVQGEVIGGKNIRRTGQEIAENQVVFEAGHQLSPASIGLVASLGLTEVKVYKKPSVRIISTGNELVPPGTKKEEGQIFESNSLALTGALQQFGFQCEGHTQINDDFEVIRYGIEVFLEKSDVLLLSGGISVGEYDFVKSALEENGVEELFYKVFQKPGKPLFFGRKENKFVFALPGNPASSLTCFYFYVLPILKKMAGAKDFEMTRISIPLAHDYSLASDRPTFLKARFAYNQVSILDGQGSSMIHSMAMGNALVLIQGPNQFKEGDRVDCLLL